MKYFGIKDKCCKNDNMEFYDADYDRRWYQCKTCLRIFESMDEFYNYTRYDFSSNYKIIFELHLLLTRHNYLIWKNSSS